MRLRLLLLLLAIGLAAGCAVQTAVRPKALDLTPAVDQAESEINAALLRLGVAPHEVRTAGQATQRQIDDPIRVRWVHRSYTLTAEPTFRNLSPADYAAAVDEGARRAGARMTARRLAPGGQPSPALRLTVEVPVPSSGRTMRVEALEFVVRAPDGRRPQPLPPARPESDGRPRMAIIIDDWGYEQSIAEGFFSLPVPLTMAVIPHLPASERLARTGHARGWEVLVHLPMEPENASLARGPGLVRVSQSDAEIRQLVAEDLAAVPYAVGVNNHMGSRATRDSRVMGLVLAEVGARGLFFVDSRTSPASIAARTARERGLAYGENYAFLDGREDVVYIRETLRALVRGAQANGFAIGIGHVRPHTLAALQIELPALLRSGVAIVPVSILVKPDFAYRHRPAAPPQEPFMARPSPSPAPSPAPETPSSSPTPPAGEPVVTPVAPSAPASPVNPVNSSPTQPTAPRLPGEDEAAGTPPSPPEPPSQIN